VLNMVTFSRLQLGVLFSLFFFSFLGGCATKIAVTPQVEKIDIKSNLQLRGVMEYNGSNKEYLPQTIKEDSCHTSLSFKYEYQIAYGRDKTPQALPLFNPLTIVGFPIGENTIVVTGTLTIQKGKEVIKEYKATCGMEKVRNLFSEGETFSELRKKGLIMVRDNIDLQMHKDREFLSSLVSSN
jgi:hypothetical protein